MLRTILKILAGFLGFILLLAVCTLTTIDRSPYQEQAFYQEIDERLDSLQAYLQLSADTATFEVGWAVVNLTPRTVGPLAGYGARKPKEWTAIHDSAFVRTIVLRQGTHQAALVTADLLVIHPELSQRVWETLPDGWSKSQIYFSATHTHSGPGGWAPGLVGKLFSGTYDPQLVDWLATQIVGSIRQANANAQPGAIGYTEMQVPDLVRNRIVDSAQIDPYLKVLRLQSNANQGLWAVYSAHATCFSKNFTELSGDYPAALLSALKQDTTLAFAGFAAGAVGSMGPKVGGAEAENVQHMASHLHDELQMVRMINGSLQLPTLLHSFQVPLPMRAPHFKITPDLALRPYLFRYAFGGYPHFLSVLIVGRTVLIGMPCDFSGELALPLYSAARERELNLIITSFNGDYAGYIINDQWYDLKKYEALTMSWYGPDAGAYLTEVTERLLAAIDENLPTDIAH